MTSALVMSEKSDIIQQKVVVCYSVMEKKCFQKQNALVHLGNFDYEIMHRYNSHFS